MTLRRIPCAVSLSVVLTADQVVAASRILLNGLIPSFPRSATTNQLVMLRVGRPRRADDSTAARHVATTLSVSMRCSR